MAALNVLSRKGIRGSGRYAPRGPEAPRAKSKYDDIPIQQVWEEYRRTNAEDIRNYLMEKFLPLVRYNAERIHQKLPDEVDIEDLMQAGTFGLKDAVDAFDLERKVKFETYCAPRIRGAILDELRSMDWVPRLVRHRTARFESIRQQIEMETGESPTDSEVASRVGLEGEEFDKLKRDGTPVSIRSLTQRCFSGENGKDVREIDVIRDETQANPLSEMARRDLKDFVTKGLNRAERLIVVLYYYENMTMKEIGATLALSESRVSQMHSSILLRLKAQMQHRMRELEPDSDE
ncbi:MAG: RNA polymerase sigma factor WhiG [Phycisphaerae bacterium]|nr:RNA polymerase sigma factor FliA [Phycisphaerales bacterium]MCK6476961.1 FliA/WhiG family RNA polymerase sigma factor [Phycisphaerales bacterium]